LAICHFGVSHISRSTGCSAVQNAAYITGEKLYEELLADDEKTLPTSHKKLLIASARAVDAAWVNSLLQWISTSHEKDEQAVKKELETWVEEYQVNISID
jgi:FlaA1/EpsC-like NDP-sugar epimerase